MACKTVCKLCQKLVISQSVTFSNGNLIINLPDGNYSNGEKYCIVIAQAIPDTATINAPVVITIGAGTTTYPLTRRDCTQATACSVRTRTRYATRVVTSAVGGTFRLLGMPCCAPNNVLPSLNSGTTPAPTGGETA